MLNESTVKRLFYEEAEKLGITLGAEHSVNWQVHQSATEEEARQAISQLLIAGNGKVRYPSQEAFQSEHGEHPEYEEVFRRGSTPALDVVASRCLSCEIGEFIEWMPPNPSTPPSH